jgi:hypothetical protein
LKESSGKMRFSLAFIMLAAILAVILPWEGYVFAKTGKVILLSGAGPVAVVDGLTFAVRPGDGGNQVVFSDDVMSLMRRAEAENLTAMPQIFGFLKEELVNQPAALMKLVGWKILRAWYATSQMWWEDRILLAQLIYLIPGLLGIIYAFKKYKDKIRSVIFLLSIILYFWLMTVLALSILRYMVPVMGMVMFFSVIAISILLDKIRIFSKQNFGHGQ